MPAMLDDGMVWEPGIPERAAMKDANESADPDEYSGAVVLEVTALYDAIFFFSSGRRHTRCYRDWSSDVCSSDLEGRLQPAGVGAGVGGAVAPHGGPGQAAVAADGGGQRAGQAGAEPSGGPGEEVVESRGGPSEAAIAVAAVADHGVQGVGGTIGGDARGAGDCPPQQRA